MGYITSFGYFQGAIWFYNLRAPQICFRNFWDQKIDQDETRDGCGVYYYKCLIVALINFDRMVPKKSPSIVFQRTFSIFLPIKRNDDKIFTQPL